MMILCTFSHGGPLVFLLTSGVFSVGADDMSAFDFGCWKHHDQMPPIISKQILIGQNKGKAIKEATHSFLSEGSQQLQNHFSTISHKNCTDSEKSSEIMFRNFRIRHHCFNSLASFFILFSSNSRNISASRCFVQASCSSFRSSSRVDFPAPH